MYEPMLIPDVILMPVSANRCWVQIRHLDCQPFLVFADGTRNSQGLPIILQPWSWAPSLDRSDGSVLIRVKYS